MDTECYGFEFSAEDYEGYRLIRAVIPEIVDVSTLSAAISRYLELWDVPTPIVVINDARRLRILTEDVRPVLLAVLKRNLLQPGFRGSCWYTDGSNDQVYSQLRDVMREAGRDPNSVVSSEEEAMAYLLGLLQEASS